MSPHRRRALAQLLATTGGLAGLFPARAQKPSPATAAPGDPTAPPPPGDGDVVRRGRALTFPRDHGAHPGARTEWWYATGWMGPLEAPVLGFQLTFFRSRTGLAAGNPSRFAARQLLFAHAAVTDLAGRRHLHAQRIARWSGDPGAPGAAAAVDDARIRLGDWSLRRDGERWLARLPGAEFGLDLVLERTQPLLLQGDAGFSRKGPRDEEASHYVSEPQLQASGAVTVGRSARPATRGRAWLDHEWSDRLLNPDAVGWDWLGMNLADGSALTAFVLRRRDGSPLWAGGSWRTAGGAVQPFATEAVRLLPGRVWQSPASNARYPVQWSLQTPAGVWSVRALLDAQELDSRASTGAIYWEGLSELLDTAGRRVGLGYLEMTGYAGDLRLN